MEEIREEKLRRECKDLHENIKKGLNPDIDRLLKVFPNEKHFYNEEKESAAAIALEWEEIEIFRSLTSKGLCLGQHEDANKLTITMEPRMKPIVREINMKYSIDVADHISILISKSKISHNACEHEVSEMEECIRKAFIDLNKIYRIQPILKVVAYAGKPSIMFDFYDHKISNMDLTTSKSVRGICYPTGRWEGDILIGAKDLMEAEEKYLEALGTLAHELTHYAMQLLYQNDCNPYKCSQDKEKAFGEPEKKLRKTEESREDQEANKNSEEDRFSDICRKCEEKCEAKDSEPRINAVFGYPEAERHAELIVRVPQLLVLHRNDKAKFSQIESTYSELFNFFEENVLADIESVLHRMKIIYKLNQAFKSKLQNIEYYVERKFIRLDANFEEITEDPMTEDQLVDHTKNVKILLLSDEPGAGKTTNLIAIAGKLKKRYPDHWIVVIDLKEFSNCYKKDGDESTTFTTIDEIINYYCKKIFQFKNLEAKNFAELFEDNRVIFLMDGFDEISPSYKEFNLKLINAIMRESKNRIWISTRPHLEKELQDKLNCSVFRLNPFTIKDRREFLELKWKSEVDKKFLNEKIQKVEAILNEIIEKSRGVDPTMDPTMDPASNPLILAIISEVLDELSNQANSQLNLYLIYETFVSKKKKIFFKKGPEAEEQMIDQQCWMNINVFHHELALVTLLDSTGSLGRSDFWHLLCGRTTLPSSEDVARLGLMVYEENSDEIYKKIRFVHRTFAEYFVADFIIEGFSKFNIREDYGTREGNLRSETLEKKLSLCTDSKGVDTEGLFNFILDEYLFDSHASLAMVRHFIYSFWETRSYADSTNYEKIQNFEKALNSSEILFKNIFYLALEDGSDCWFKDVPKRLEVILRSVEFWEPRGLDKYSAMMLSVNNSASFFSEFLEFINKFLDPSVWRKMFFEVGDWKRHILWYCSSETFKLILSDSPMIPLTRQEKEELLQTPDIFGLNMLLYYVTCKSIDEFKKYYKAVNDFDEGMAEKLLQDFSSNDKYSDQSILHYLLSYDMYLKSSLEIVREFFELSTIKGMFKIKDGFPTLLMLLPIEIINLVELETFWNFFEDIFEDEEERISIMRQEYAVGFSAFDFAFFESRLSCLKSSRYLSLTFIKEKYEIVYNEEEMRQRIMRNISSFSEADKADFLESRDWHLDTLMKNMMSVFSKDFVRSLFPSYDGKRAFLKDKKTLKVLKFLLIENKIFSDDEMSKLF